MSDLDPGHWGQYQVEWHPILHGCLYAQLHDNRVLLVDVRRRRIASRWTEVGLMMAARTIITHVSWSPDEAMLLVISDWGMARIAFNEAFPDC